MSVRTRGLPALVALERARAIGARALTHTAGELPDDSWLSHLELNGSRVRLRGESLNASELVRSIEKSAVFAAGALALAAALLAIGYFARARPFFEAHRRYEPDHRQAAAQPRAEKGGGAKLRVRQVLEECKRLDVAQRHYLAKCSVALASAELQSLVKNVVAGQGRAY